MKRIVQAGIMVFCVFCMAGTLLATDLPRVMFMGEDVNRDTRDTVPRHSKVFDQVLYAMVGEMLNEGFDVKDETALTLETHLQGGQRRMDPELISIAKEAGVDVLVIFSIHYSIKKSYSTVKVGSRIIGRMLNVYSGSLIGRFNVESPQYQPVNKPYGPDEVIEGIGKVAKNLGREAGAEVAMKLADRVDQAGGMLLEWNLVFDGFTEDDVQTIQEFLIQFDGYDSHRPKRNGGNANTYHEYLYKSSIDSAELKRQLYKTLKKLKMRNRIYFSGNTFKIEKLAKSRQRRAKRQSEW